MTQRIIEGTSTMLAAYWEDEQNNMEIERMEKDKSTVISLRLEEEAELITVSIKNKRSYIPCNAVTIISDKKYFEFYYKLFTTPYAGVYNVIFAKSDNLYQIPAEKMINSEDVILTAENKLNRKIYVNVNWCNGYKMF